MKKTAAILLVVSFAILFIVSPGCIEKQNLKSDEQISDDSDSSENSFDNLNPEDFNSEDDKLKKSGEALDLLMMTKLSELSGDVCYDVEDLFLSAKKCAKIIEEEPARIMLSEEQDEKFSLKTPDTEKLKNLKFLMAQILLENDCVLTISYIGNDAVVRAVYPEQEGFLTGDSLSNQKSVMDMNKNKIPVITDIFELKQGGYAAALYYPVFLNNTYEGFISIAFSPDIFFRDYAEKLQTNSGLELMVLQKDSLILYDPDESEIGKQTLGNPEYENFPEILKSAEKISAEWSGSTNYSYFSTGTNQIVKKRQFWTTVICGGNEWKLTVLREI